MRGWTVSKAQQSLLKSQKDIKRGSIARFFIVLNNYPDYQSLQGNPFPIFCVFLSKQSGKRSLVPDVTSAEPVDGF